MVRITKEKFKTFENVFDNYTIRNLIDLAKKGVFVEGTISPIKIGKEANIFSAETETKEKLCLKIYRLETANFNRMFEYIRSDPRFSGLQHKRRKVLFAWVQREYRNLITAERAGVTAPKPVDFQLNVLIMEFIGKGKAAPMLKDAPPKYPKLFLDKVIEGMRKLYRAGMVHGDLSKFNILSFNESPVFIDFSHATPKNNPIFKRLLDRDAKHIAEDFKLLSKQEILKRIIS